MIEIICREIDVGAAYNVGGPVETRYVQFKIEHPEMEQWLRGGQEKYGRREIVGMIETAEKKE